MSVTPTTYTNIRRTNSSTNRLFIVTPLVLLAVGMGLLGARARVPDNVIAPGVQVGSVKLAGKNVEEARALLQQWADVRVATQFNMRFAAEAQINKTWTADAHKMGLGLDVAATLEDVAKAGRENLIGQVSHMITGANTVVVPAHITVDAVQLRAYLKQIAYKINHKPRNARLQLSGKTIASYVHDRPGLGMDVDGSANAVTQAWTRFNSIGAPAAATNPTDSAHPAAPVDTSTQGTAKPEQTVPPATTADPNAHQKPASEGTGKPAGETKPPAAATVNTPASNTNASNTIASSATTDASSASASPSEIDVQLLANITPADITYADIKQINGILGSKVTDIGGTANRHSNVALAARRINGTVLRPGEVFSYNKTVGPRETYRGFKEAPEIVHGVLKPGIGGGVCQVSTTLFNAVLRSNLKIVNRSHHAFPVHYVDPGLDATVVDGDIDFQFQNDTASPIYIYALGHDGDLTFRVYGKTVPGRSVSMVRTRQSYGDYDTETESDSSLPSGHREVKVPGHPRIDVTWDRVVKENGVVVKREPLTTHYHSISEVVIVGTHARTTAPKPTGKTPAAPAPAATALPAPSPVLPATGQ